MKKEKTITPKGNLIKLSVQNVHMIKGGKHHESKVKRDAEEGDGTGG